MPASHYQTLGVPKTADSDTIKRAFRRKLSKAHPDRAGGDHKAMIALNRAHETLSDPQKRARYDETGQDGATPPVDVRARGVIMGLFQQAVDQASDQQDLIELMRHSIRKGQQDDQQKAAELRKKVAVMERRRKRLKYKGAGANFLLDLLDQRITSMTHMAALMETETKVVGDRALELLRDFEYEPELPAGQVGGRLFTFVVNLG